MAGGPIFPYSAVPTSSTGLVFAGQDPGVGAGTNNPNIIEGMGVAANLSADSAWACWYQMPPVMPSGTPKLYFRALSNGSAGVAKVTAYTVSIAPTGFPSGPPGYAETQQTLTWLSDAANTAYTVKAIALGASGGTGYVVGDTIVCAGGTAVVACILRVAAVAAGVVTSFQILQQGVYTAKPAAGALTQASTSGSGTGALATATFDSVGSADHLLEAKLVVTPQPVANGLYGVNYVFNTTGWTLASASYWQMPMIWE